MLDGDLARRWARYRLEDGCRLTASNIPVLTTLYGWHKYIRWAHTYIIGLEWMVSVSQGTQGFERIEETGYNHTSPQGWDGLSLSSLFVLISLPFLLLLLFFSFSLLLRLFRLTSCPLYIPGPCPGYPPLSSIPRIPPRNNNARSTNYLCASFDCKCLMMSDILYSTRPWIN